jgi:hypothetical protein
MREMYVLIKEMRGMKFKLLSREGNVIIICIREEVSVYCNIEGMVV